MTDHESMKQLAAGYVLLALEHEEQEAFAGHLAACPECATEVAELRAVLDVLPETVQQSEPPAALRQRVLAAVQADRSAPAPPLPRQQGRLRRLFGPARKKQHAPRRSLQQATPANRDRAAKRLHIQWRAAAAAMAACLFVALGAAGSWAFSAQGRLGQANQQLDRSYDALRVMASADQRWQVSGGAESPGAAGILAYSSRQKASSVVLWGVSLAPGRDYIAWTQKDGARTPIGAMQAADSGLWLVAPVDAAQIDGVGVTMREGDARTEVLYFDLAAPQQAAGPMAEWWGD